MMTVDIIKTITDYLNPGQIPVIANDQPLFALSKYMQWRWPETHDERMFVVMFFPPIQRTFPLRCGEKR